MKKLVCMVIALCLFSVPTFAIKTQYRQIGYHETFYNEYKAKLDRQEVLVQSDGVNKRAVVLDQVNEKSNEEVTPENNLTESK